MRGGRDGVTGANLAAWDAYAAERLAADGGPQALPGRLDWTQTPGAGPGVEILGPVRGRRLLELGCGGGGSAAYLADQGADVTGVDGSAAQVCRASRRWRHPRLAFLHAEAGDYLSRPGPAFDLIISIFGALDWSPPGRLLPLIARRLGPRGVLAFSAVHPDRARGVAPELGCPSGRAVPVVRHAATAESWAAHLGRAGLVPVRTLQVSALPGGGASCLVITAERARG